MKGITFILALISFVSGLFAAYHWYLAIRVGISSAWEMDILGDRDKNVMSRVTGNMIAFTKSGKLNTRAAWLTAISVACGTIANFLALLA
jgi:hypothetical protein